jgi:hypothetical protein
MTKKEHEPRRHEGRGGHGGRKAEAKAGLRKDCGGIAGELREAGGQIIFHAEKQRRGEDEERSEGRRVESEKQTLRLRNRPRIAVPPLFTLIKSRRPATARRGRLALPLIRVKRLIPFPREQYPLEAEPCRGFACEARCWSTAFVGSRLSSRASQATPLQKSDFHWEWGSHGEHSSPPHHLRASAPLREN